MVKFSYDGINNIKEMINTNELKELGKLTKTSFTRERKMGFTKLINYILNKKGLSTNMEINNFYNKINEDNTISSQSLLDQRLKLNPEVFIYLNNNYLKLFYNEHKDEVKTYKNYILKAIDGSDFEIPNTKESKKVYGTIINNKEDSIPRATVSTSYDLLNKYVVEGFISQYRTGEVKSALEHIKNDKNITTNYNSIYIMDRGYVSIELMLYCIMNNIKFLIRLDGTAYKNERSGITTNDEYIDLKYTRGRIKKRYIKDETMRLYAKEIKSSKLRVVTYVLNTGEIEQLITNLEYDYFSYDDIVELYKKRWGIETLYYSLKSKLEIEKFTSSFKILIEQDFFSSVLVFNMIQSMMKEAEEKIEKNKYKHEMTINENMAIGLFKNEMIYIMLEDDKNKRLELYDRLINKISKYKIPIRKDRKYKINFRTNNKHSFNKLKSF